MNRFRRIVCLLAVLGLAFVLAGCGGIIKSPEGMYTLTITSQGQGAVPQSGQKYNPNTVVTLTPQPAQGYAFVRWEGANASEVADNKIVMNGNKNLTAVFEQSLVSPVSLQATTGSSGSTGWVQLTWTADNSKPIKQFHIWRKTSAYETTVRTLTSDFTAWRFENLTIGEEHTYWVQAEYTDGSLAYRGIGVRVVVGDPTPELRPKKPGDPTLTTGTEGSRYYVNISWPAVTQNENNTPCNDLKGYNIYRVVNGAPTLFQFVDKSRTDFKAYFDVPDAEFECFIKAVDLWNYESTQSASASVIIGGQKPRTPTFVTLDQDPLNGSCPLSGGQMRLTWTNSDVSVVKYYIYRDDSATPTATVTTTTYTDTGLIPGRTYKYTVVAANSNDRKSDPSTPFQAVAQ